MTGSFALVCELTGCQPAPPVDSENDDGKHKVSKEIWKDDKAQMNRFLDDLMNKMTLEEKISQMTLFASDWRIIGFAVHAGVLDGSTVCRMFNSIIGGTKRPRYLSSDNDPLFLFRQRNANLRILEVPEVKTVPYVPLSHPFVERLIGTIRREYLDQVPFWSARDLERKLLLFKKYYNRDRVHRGLDRAPPDKKAGIMDRTTARLNDYRWEKCCRGLYQLPAAA